MESARPATFAERLQAAWLTRGLLARALLPLAGLYGIVVALRAALYRVGLLRSERLPVPVIVVGNLIVGGAGKTPTAIALVAMLRRNGYVPGLVSRGYGRSEDGLLEVTRGVPAAQCGDEPLLLHLRTQAPVVVGRDRVAAGRELLRLHPLVDVIVADDGLQHLALARDAQVLVFDERGVGNGWLLPAGPLREPVPDAVPARSLVVFNAASPSTGWTGVCARRRLTGVVALQAWWLGAPATSATLDALRGRPLVAAAGVARPQRFFSMLRERQLTFTELALPDHHPYTVLPWPVTTPDVVLTEKDAIKLDPARTGSTRIWVAPLDFELDDGFATALTALLAPNGTRHGNSPA